MYCENCGTKLFEGMKFCPNCGTNVDQVFSNGNSQQSTVNVELLESGQQEFVNVSTKKVEVQEQEFIDLSNSSLSSNIQNAPVTESSTSRSLHSNDMYMSSTELWSWLKRTSKRSSFYTDEICSLTEGDFIDKIREKIVANNVPATIEQKYIQWDRTNIARDIYFVRPNTDAINPLTCIIQFNKVGNFSFVEEKTFITPPQLPEVPMEKKEINPNLRQNSVGSGVFCIIIGLALYSVNSGFALMVLICGIICIVDAYLKGKKIREIEEHNATADMQYVKWNNAWKNWEKNIFYHSFQEDVNGNLSRIYDSVFACIKQVCDEVYKTKKEKEQVSELNINELEQMISRRKDEYK